MGGKLIFVIILSYLLQFKKDNPIFSAPRISSTYSFHIRQKSKKKIGFVMLRAFNSLLNSF